MFKTDTAAIRAHADRVAGISGRIRETGERTASLAGNLGAETDAFERIAEELLRQSRIIQAEADIAKVMSEILKSMTEEYEACEQRVRRSAERGRGAHPTPITPVPINPRPGTEQPTPQPDPADPQPEPRIIRPVPPGTNWIIPMPMIRILKITDPRRALIKLLPGRVDVFRHPGYGNNMRLHPGRGSLIRLARGEAFVQSMGVRSGSYYFREPAGQTGAFMPGRFRYMGSGTVGRLYYQDTQIGNAYRELIAPLMNNGG